jgi:hypothetical protein
VKALDVLAGVLESLDQARGYLGATIGSVIAGLVLGLLGRAGLGRRGQFYGAMMGGMILNLVAKFEDASYLTALVLMGTVTAITFGLGYTPALRLLLRARGPGGLPGGPSPG